jgi:shikimate kinase
VGDHLVLVGMMGSGKTTIGRMLAARLGRPYFDTDDEVVRLAGATVSGIFSSEGEAGFRRRESGVLAQLLASAIPSVVSAGGGVVLDAHNRALLHDAGAVVWLRATAETLGNRVGDAPDRPLLAGSSGPGRRERLVRLCAEREPLYDEVATLVLDVDGLEPAAVADEVLGRVGPRHHDPMSDEARP